MKLLKVQDLAELLQVSVDTVRRWVREKRIPVLRPTQRTVRFDEDDVRKALRKGGKAG